MLFLILKSIYYLDKECIVIFEKLLLLLMIKLLFGGKIMIYLFRSILYLTYPQD